MSDVAVHEICSTVSWVLPIACIYLWMIFAGRAEHTHYERGFEKGYAAGWSEAPGYREDDQA